MKKYTLMFLSLVISMTSCNAQKKKNIPNNVNKSKTMIIPNRNIRNIEIPSLEKMDNQFQRNDSIETKSLSGRRVKLKKITKNIVNDSNYSLEEYDSNGLARKMFIENSRLHSIDEVYRDKINAIIINKEWTDHKDTLTYIDINYNYTFYDTGELKKIKGHSNNVPVGNWYFYDQSGRELYHIDIEKYFKISLIQILDMASKVNIENYPSYSVSRLFDANHSYWKLEYFQLNDEGGGTSRIVLINDNNGKIIYNELKGHEPDYRSSGIINYNSIYKYMNEIFEPFDR